MELIIRKESEKDHQKVFSLLKAAFGKDNEAVLVEKLRKRNDFIPDLSLIAEMNEELVAYILFTKISIIREEQAYETLALAPVAVHPEYQKKGIGKKLITDALSRCRQLGFRSVIVLGHAEYYPAFGFKPACNWNISAPFEVPSEAFMALELSENELAGKSGRVEYPPEFSEV